MIIPSSSKVNNGLNAHPSRTPFFKKPENGMPVLLPGIGTQPFLFPSWQTFHRIHFEKAIQAFKQRSILQELSVAVIAASDANTTTTKLTVDVKEAAKLLGLGLNVTYELVRSGRLKSVKVGKRIIIPITEIEAFLNRELN